MIKFTQKTVKKSEVLELIDNELLCIEVRLTFQRKLNEQVLSYLKSFMNNNCSTDDHEKINIMSDYLNNASRILKRSSNNLSKFESLQEKLISMQDIFSDLEKPNSNLIRTQFEDYNKKFAEVIEKSEPATSEIQAFLAQCEQDDILQELLLERELAKKANTFVDKITNIEMPSLTVEPKQEEIVEAVKEIITEENKEPVHEIVTEEIKEPIQEITAKEIKEPIQEIAAEEIKELIQEIATEEIKEPIQEITAEENKEPIQEIAAEENKETIQEIVSEENKEIVQEITTKENKEPTEEKTLFELNDPRAQLLNSIKIEKKSDEEPAKKEFEIAENTLIISEKNGTVILPYTLADLNTAIEKHPSKYKTLEDVVAKKYTRPMKYYKNSSMARFKETFKLVRERSKGPLKHAWDLSLEAFFNHDLHPAVISACKSIDELDIYLSCLEYDELEDFKFFKIIFDVLPTLSKKKQVSA